jgi:uncharacterized membrane protein YphA (DoxX/SURF4 family)
VSDGTEYAAAVVLALVFFLAGLAKLRRPAVTARSFAGLGLPAPGPLSVAVPIVELVLAVGLLLVPAIAAALALLLLVAFTVVLASAIRAGKQVGCGCLGSTRNDPVSAVEIVRNGMLAAAAVVALGATEPVMPELGDVIAVTTAAAVALVVLALADVRRTTGGLWSTGAR